MFCLFFFDNKEKTWTNIWIVTITVIVRHTTIQNVISFSLKRYCNRKATTTPPIMYFKTHEYFILLINYYFSKIIISRFETLIYLTILLHFCIVYPSFSVIRTGQTTFTQYVITILKHTLIHQMQLHYLIMVVSNKLLYIIIDL